MIYKVRQIVAAASRLKDKHTTEIDAQVSYACMFSQNDKEYEKLKTEATELGTLLKETKTGPIFKMQPLETVSGLLQILKIRKPDKKRPEKGAADFTVSNYRAFKKNYIPKKGFELIEGGGYEMIELVDKEINVRAHFSNPPVNNQLGVK